MCKCAWNDFTKQLAGIVLLMEEIVTVFSGIFSLESRNFAIGAALSAATCLLMCRIQYLRKQMEFYTQCFINLGILYCFFFEDLKGFSTLRVGI